MKASGLDAVLAGLSPAAVSPPQGSREGQFARAPVTGVPSSGATQPGMPTIPGLVSRGTPVVPSTARSAPAINRNVYRELVLPGVNRTMSAPLRPSSRIIPVSVEAQFANLNVYTLVIPNPGPAEYSSDWVMWFSERQPGEGENLHISAPIPSRKYSRVDQRTSSANAPVKATFQLAATIDHMGHLAAIRVLRGSTAAELRSKAVEDLETWEFKPALRNGDAIDVDVVLEIPFQLRLEAAGPQPQ
jgi:TonB family protein